MASCADCGRIIFRRSVVSRYFLGLICERCGNLEWSRSHAENEGRVLDRIHALPSPVTTPAQVRPDGTPGL